MNYYLDVIDDEGNVLERVECRMAETLEQYFRRFYEYEADERTRLAEKEEQESIANIEKVAQMAEGNPVWREEREDD